MITKVLLRDRQTHRYYAGPGQWVAHVNQALDLGEPSRAEKIFEEEGVHFAEILIDYGTLPVGPKPSGGEPKPQPQSRGSRHS